MCLIRKFRLAILYFLLRSKIYDILNEGKSFAAQCCENDKFYLHGSIEFNLSILGQAALTD